jgi:hypothetical protein
LVAEPENYWLEKTGLSLFLFVSNMLYFFVAVRLLENRRIRLSKLKNNKNTIKEQLKENEQSLNEIETDIQSWEREQTEHSHDYYSGKAKSLNKDLKERQDIVTSLQNKRKEIKNKIAKTKLGSTILLFFLSLFFGAFFILAFLPIFQSAKGSIITAIIILIAIRLSAGLSVLMDKKDAVSPSFLSSCAKEKRISNFWIVFFVVIALLGGASYSIYEYCAGNSAAITKTAFETTQTHEKLCAIIVADSDYLIAEEIKISDDNKSAIIYSDSVFIIPKETEPVLEKKSFEKPPIVKVKGEDE